MKLGLVTLTGLPTVLYLISVNASGQSWKQHESGSTPAAPWSRIAGQGGGVSMAATCGNGVLESPAEECEPGSGGMGEPLDSNCPGRCIAAGAPGQCTCERPCVLADCEFCPVSYGTNGPFLTHGGMFTFVPDTPFTLLETCGSDYNTELNAGISPACDALTAYNDECATQTCDLTQDVGSVYSACFDSDCTCTATTRTNCNGKSCLCVSTPVGQPYNILVGETGFAFVPPLGSNTVIKITRMTSCDLGPMPMGACCNPGTGNCTDGVPEAHCQGGLIFTADTTCAAVACGPNSVPAVSDWGQAVLFSLMLICGTICLGRAKRGRAV
jgi:hypothetical protein